jgi:hypothetical protein
MIDKSSILFDNRIALVALSQNTKFYRELCHELHECAAHLTAISIFGQVTSGWDAGEATRIELAIPSSYCAMILILDNDGASQLLAAPTGSTFVRSFIKDGKPSLSFGEEEGYIKSIGLLTEEELLSEKFKSEGDIRRFGSLTMVPSDCTPKEFASLIKSEICHKLHPEYQI